ncbi:MAG: deoxyribodipyrimidine photolyase [Flavobacteriales bacterium]|nr:deoxyribodipyrimidine photolyase [Flavobacteriales bacterium]
MNFSTDIEEIKEAVNSFDPRYYARTRNFTNGSVSRLSPYISRGVISTRDVMQNLIERSYDLLRIEKFIQELAWRDYWQQVWIAKDDLIFNDFKHAQLAVEYHGIPSAIVKGETGIYAIDESIKEFYTTGYMHNHIRMYLAAITCNVGHYHWKSPARWLYYHLLDGDLASNHLSWQWVAGSNANKKYIANQDNINKYCHSDQKGTFLDISYDELAQIETPDRLQEEYNQELEVSLPRGEEIEVRSELPTYIYNWYNLDADWDIEQEANRILLIEPSIFSKHPISEQSMKFMLDLSKNIENIQVYVGEFSTLKSEYSLAEIHYKEHPLNSTYSGIEHPRDWMFNVSGYFASFFGFWKKCKKELIK